MKTLFTVYAYTVVRKALLSVGKMGNGDDRGAAGKTIIDRSYLGHAVQKSALGFSIPCTSTRDRTSVVMGVT